MHFDWQLYTLSHVIDIHRCIALRFVRESYIKL